MTKVPAPGTVLHGILGIEVENIGKVRIGVIHHEIQALLRHFMTVNMPKEPVMSDKDIFRQILPEDIALKFAVISRTVRPERLCFQQLMRIHYVVGSCSGKKDLLPVSIRLVPEDCPPRFIQSVQRSVLVLDILSESAVVSFAVVFISLAVEFVVYLPADNAFPEA